MPRPVERCKYIVWVNDAINQWHPWTFDTLKSAKYFAKYAVGNQIIITKPVKEEGK